MVSADNKGASLMARWLASLLSVWSVGLAVAADPWLVLPGGTGAGTGKHIVLVSGDEEYRSEECIPQLARILATHHGFKCTVLFAIDPKDGTVNPGHLNNIPGLEALASADAAVFFLRFRDLPDEQMAHIAKYLEAGKPLIGLRTTTHAFNIKGGKTYSTWSYGSKEKGWEGGFGKRIFGETWFSHHGAHGSQSTRGVRAPGQETHPILRGIEDGDIWGPTDVYGVRLPLPGDSQPLVLGQVLTGMKPTDPPLKSAKNDPMMPIVWTKSYSIKEGVTGKALCSTIASSQDLESEGVRRLYVNAVYWAAGLSEQIPAKSKVDIVGTYKATPFKAGQHVKGLKPEDFLQ
jgi:hypothetical protein